MKKYWLTKDKILRFCLMRASSCSLLICGSGARIDPGWLQYWASEVFLQNFVMRQIVIIQMFEDYKRKQNL